jgi:hypothetical protein
MPAASSGRACCFQHILQNVHLRLVSRRKWIGNSNWLVDNIIVPHPILWHILDGTAAITVDDEQHYGKVGDIFLYRPGCKLYAKPGNDNPPVLFSIHFEARVLGGKELAALANLPTRPVVANPERLQALVSNLGEDAPSEKIGFPLLALAHILEILAMIMEEAFQGPGPPVLDNPYVVAAVQYIHDNLTSCTDVGKLSQDLAISPSHLRALFAKYLNMSPSQYVQSVRLSMAYERLALPCAMSPSALALMIPTTSAAGLGS